MRSRAALLLILTTAAVIPFLLIDTPLYARIIAIAGVCLVLWLTEAVPPFVPTLLLLAAVPLILFPIDPRFSMGAVLGMAFDPVLALFFGGFALGLAAERFGLDRQLIAAAMRSSGGSPVLLLALVMLLTAFLSMWLSNIAAAALIFACLRSAFASVNEDSISRRTLLIGVALAADLGGMATPIGTGPNAVAIASLGVTHSVSFIKWMAFALPLTIGMLALGFVMLLWRLRRDEQPLQLDTSLLADEAPVEQKGRTTFLVIIAATVVLWLTEPLHGVPAAVTSIGASTALFGTATLGKEHLRKIDWSTLILIAGGIALGKLLESSGMIAEWSADLPIASLPSAVALFLICITAALMAALMSNTASVILLIPLATVIIPEPSTAILVAIAASFGLPFLISTPPNAMAFGEGGVRFGDLFWPGIVIMLVGCFLISTTGPFILRTAGL